MKKKLLIILLILFVFMPIPVFASAGGGHASGGGSASGGSSNNHRTGTSNHTSHNPLTLPLFIGFTFISSHLYAFYHLKKAKEKDNINKKFVKKFETNDPVWNIKKLKKRIKKVFYQSQDSWTKQNTDGFKDILTPQLYDNWCTQIEWQIFQNDRNVLKHIHLLTISFVDIYDDTDNNQDRFCVYIQASMVDYMESEKQPHELLRWPGLLSEYWYFQRIDNEFYLDEIKQIEEIEIE